MHHHGGSVPVRARAAVVFRKAAVLPQNCRAERPFLRPAPYKKTTGKNSNGLKFWPNCFSCCPPGLKGLTNALKIGIIKRYICAWRNAYFWAAEQILPPKSNR